jgi:hypothetical protein
MAQLPRIEVWIGQTGTTTAIVIAQERYQLWRCADRGHEYVVVG